MNYPLLKSVMALNGDSVSRLAEYLGITYQGLKNKLDPDGNEFKQTEIKRIAERYNLSDDELIAIFFDGKVSGKTQKEEP